MANLPSLKPDENSQKLPVHAEYPKFSEMLLQSFPDSWVIFGIYPTLPQVQDSWVLSLPGSLWALKHKPKLFHAFVSLYLPLLIFLWIISWILWKWNSCSLGTSSVQTCPLGCWWGLYKLSKASSRNALICVFASWFGQCGGTNWCCWNKKRQSWLNGLIRERWQKSGVTSQGHTLNLRISTTFHIKAWHDSAPFKIILT